MSQEQTNSQEQGKEAKKVLANFDNTIAKLTAIVQGPANLKTPSKVKKDAMGDLVAELFKEETEATAKEVKEGLKNLLKGHVTLNNTLNAERKKLDLLEITKKKEFNNAAAQLFNKIEGVDSILHDYRGALGEAQTAVMNTEEKTDEEKEE